MSTLATPLAPALLAVAILAAAGCSSRPGPPVRLAPPGAPSATIVNTSDGGIGGVKTYLVSVDGRRVPYRRATFGPDLWAPVIVPAGPRRLEVTIEQTNYLWGQTFDFPLVADHRYALTYNRRGDRLVVVVDRTTGTRTVIEKPRRP